MLLYCKKKIITPEEFASAVDETLAN
jgi:hypothetical protein